MWCIAIAPINYSEKMQSLTCWTVGVCYIGIFLVLNLQPSQALPINNEVCNDMFFFLSLHCRIFFKLLLISAQAVKRERTERNLSEYILHLLGITPTTEVTRFTVQRSQLQFYNKLKAGHDISICFGRLGNQLPQKQLLLNLKRALFMEKCILVLVMMLTALR